MKHIFHYCPNCKRMIGTGSREPFFYCEKCNREYLNYTFDEPAFNSRILYSRKAWEASDKRLKDPEYALKLKLAGFPVPDRYIADEMKPLFVSMEKKKKEDYDELMRDQKKYRVGKMMLAAGKNSKDVIECAEKMKLSVSDFLSLCREWVDSYQEKHREYNLTHYPPAKYPDDWE